MADSEIANDAYDAALGVMRTNLLPTPGTTYFDGGRIAYPDATYTDRTRDMWNRAEKEKEKEKTRLDEPRYIC